MSSVDVSDTQAVNPALTAGNNVNSLAPTNVNTFSTGTQVGLPSAADLDHIAEEFRAAALTLGEHPLTDEPPTTGKPFTASVSTVSQEEFEVLKATVNTLERRIESFNARSGQKI